MIDLQAHKTWLPQPDDDDADLVLEPRSERGLRVRDQRRDRPEVSDGPRGLRRQRIDDLHQRQGDTTLVTFFGSLEVWIKQFCNFASSGERYETFSGLHSLNTPARVGGFSPELFSSTFHQPLNQPTFLRNVGNVGTSLFKLSWWVASEFKLIDPPSFSGRIETFLSRELRQRKSFGRDLHQRPEGVRKELVVSEGFEQICSKVGQSQIDWQANQVQW